jgi:hypothetical protein
MDLWDVERVELHPEAVPLPEARQTRPDVVLQSRDVRRIQGVHQDRPVHLGHPSLQSRAVLDAWDEGHQEIVPERLAPAIAPGSRC